ncbi:acyl-CoA thioesterase [Sulfuritalea hydrogenivorans]|uniref:Thioesterase superfamily protein n=1 Tax=Sulfuritalea hydrogenivorans sk43H TaxID=1223802 RepID=W0SAX3_9PROT|nr:thioesterase family protein [Sulfuritalea hydrogenivorans]BAO28349.1 thioesterase superfamily protein [Sulfuritalea hydrogenivorans sk43H]
MSSLLDTYRGTVYPWHCDHMNHMNVMWYVGKFDEATWNLMSHLGMSAAFLREHHRGMAAVDQRISYQRELHAGDTVAVRTGVVSVGDKKIVFFHEMRNADTDAVSAITLLTGVHLDTQARKSCHLPKATADKARELVVAYELPWTTP